MAERKRPPVVLILLVILGVVGFFVWRGFFSQPPIPGNIVIVSGRIEGDDSAVAPKTAGRLAEIRVREGDTVKAGDVLAVLDDQQIRAREDQAQAAVSVSQARLNAARQQIAVLNEQLKQGELEVVQSKVDAEGRVAQAEAELASAQAQLAQQEAAYKLAVFDRDAYTKLLQTGAVSERQAKQAVTTAETQAALVASARQRVDSARGGLNAVKATLSNPAIRSARADTIRRQIIAQQADIATAAADAQRAQFQLQEAQANRADLIVKAPFDGTIVTRTAEPGEVVQAGTAILTLLDLSKVYLRGFVPEGQIGKVKVGQPGRIYLDSNPKQPVDAEVSRIDPQATFTPENTYFREDRVKQVVGIKMHVKGAVGFAKPGMPADGEILVEGTTWPEHTGRK